MSIVLHSRRKPGTDGLGWTPLVSVVAEGGFAVSQDGAVQIIDLSYRQIKIGVAPQVVRALQDAGVLDRDDVQQIISQRTLERRLANAEALRPEESDGIARLLRVIAHANRVFEDADLAEEWLRSPNPALNDEVPMVMAARDVGAREVEGVLTRLEHGVFD